MDGYDDFRRVDQCERHELFKDFKGHAAIFKDGKFLLGGNEYMTNKRWLDIKMKHR